MSEKKENGIIITDIDDSVDLMTKMKDTRLLNNKDCKIYEQAEISVVEVKPCDIKLTTFYFVRQKLEFLVNLRKALLAQGHDLLRLESYLRFTVLEKAEDSDELIPVEWEIVPPVCELTQVDSWLYPQGTIFVLDGAHRMRLADYLGIKPMIIKAAGVSAPPYADPNEWSQTAVVEQDAIPEIKKLYQKDYRAKYRQFPGTGGFRTSVKS